MTEPPTVTFSAGMERQRVLLPRVSSLAHIRLHHTPVLKCCTLVCMQSVCLAPLSSLTVYCCGDTRDMFHHPLRNQPYHRWLAPWFPSVVMGWWKYRCKGLAFKEGGALFSKSDRVMRSNPLVQAPTLTEHTGNERVTSLGQTL